MRDATLKPGWQVWRFDQMAVNVNDRIDDPAEAGVEHYVGLEHLDTDSLKIRRWGVPTDVEATKLYFRKGDIIFGRRRAYQRKLAVADFDGICSAHAMVLRAKPDVVLPEFLPFFMQSDLFMNRAVEISVGSLSPTINWTTLAAQEFALPPLEEQRRIADTFFASLEIVEEYRHVGKTAHELLASVREDSFASRHVSVIPLGSLLKRIEAGKSVVGVNVAPNYQDAGVLKVSAVGADGFQAQESKTLVDMNDFLPQFAVRKGDLLITRANTPELVGMTCLVERDYPNLMLSDKTLRLVPSDDVSPELLCAALWTIRVRQQLKSVATGTGAAMKNISQEKITAVEVCWPKSQAKIAAVQDRIMDIQRRVRTVKQRQDLATKLHSALVNDTLMNR